MYATMVKVPAIVLAYNLFRNGVERHDHSRAESSTARDGTSCANVHVHFFVGCECHKRL